MDIASPMKPNVMTQVDYSKRRHQPEKDDLELSAAGQALLAYIEETARPKELAAAYPRIVNHMAKLWKMPREMDRYFGLVAALAVIHLRHDVRLHGGCDIHS